MQIRGVPPRRLKQKAIDHQLNVIIKSHKDKSKNIKKFYFYKIKKKVEKKKKKKK